MQWLRWLRLLSNEDFSLFVIMMRTLGMVRRDAWREQIGLPFVGTIFLLNLPKPFVLNSSQ